jgi:hypothetical protein
MPSCSPLQRCQLLDGGITACSVRDPYFRETWAPVQRFSGESIGPSWVRPFPVRRLPFPGASFGSSLFTVMRRVSRLRYSSLRVTCLLEAQPSFNYPRMRTRRCLSCDFVPYSAPQKQASVLPGDSNLRHCPSSGFLTLSTSYSACNPGQLVSSGLRSWGSTGSSRSHQPFDQCRAKLRPGFLSKAFSAPVMTASSTVSCLARHWVLRPRSASVISPPAKEAKPPNRCCTVSITETSVYPEVASQGHQLS